MKDIFESSFQRYGYRRIHSSLICEGRIISEKVVRRIMKEEGLYVYQKRWRKYNSYEGEISPEVENLIRHDFRESRPNIKWLTDITEFSIPAGKVYLSPIVDCFDDVISLLNENETSIIHSDRGCHYRWTGWIE